MKCFSFVVLITVIDKWSIQYSMSNRRKATYYVFAKATNRHSLHHSCSWSPSSARSRACKCMWLSELWVFRSWLEYGLRYPHKSIYLLAAVRIEHAAPLLFDYGVQTEAADGAVGPLVHRVHEDYGSRIVASKLSIDYRSIELATVYLPAILANPAGQSDTHLPPWTSGRFSGQIQYLEESYGRVR